MTQNPQTIVMTVETHRESNGSKYIIPVCNSIYKFDTDNVPASIIAAEVNAYIGMKGDVVSMVDVHNCGNQLN